MAQVVLGCDSNGVNDQGCIDTVAKILEDGGHSVEKLGIAPGPFASYSYGENGKNPKGKIGVYLMADSLTSIADLYDGNTGFKYAYFGIRGDLGLPRMSTMEHFKNNPIGKDRHGDCTSKSCDTLAGKTYVQINEVTKSKCIAVFGTSPEELGKNILDAMGGGSGNTEGDEETKGASNSGNVKECLQKLLTHWDGDVECVIRGKNVFINKVRDPEEFYSCALLETVNVFSDGITLTDINPNTPNHLVVEWTGGTIEMSDEKLIARFGEKLKTMTAVKKVVTYYEDKGDDDKSDDTDGTGDTGDGTGDSSSTGSSSTGDGNSGSTVDVDGVSMNVRN